MSSAPRLLCICLCFLFAALAMPGPANISWFTDPQQARQQQLATGQPALLYFYTGVSRGEQAINEAWLTPEVALASQGFVMGAMHLQHPSVAPVAEAMYVLRVPVVLVVEVNGSIVARLEARELSQASLLETMRRLGRAPVGPAVAAGASQPVVAASQPQAINPALYPYMGMVDGVGRFGDARVMYEGKPLYVKGATQADIGQPIVFTEPQDRGRFFEAELDAPRTQLVRSGVMILADGSVAPVVSASGGGTPSVSPTVGAAASTLHAPALSLHGAVSTLPAAPQIPEGARRPASTPASGTRAPIIWPTQPSQAPATPQN
jgi:hypothetical protein